jgi:UDP-N-acetylglucosamine 2-epimerase
VGVRNGCNCNWSKTASYQSGRFVVGLAPAFRIREVLIHTGQHYDPDMSSVWLELLLARCELKTSGSALGREDANISGSRRGGFEIVQSRMPEEINRIVVDHVSDISFARARTILANVAKEGAREECARGVGDVMYDSTLFFSRQMDQKTRGLKRLGLAGKDYLIYTIHRAERQATRGNCTPMSTA